jgi:hypothetical protein
MVVLLVLFDVVLVPGVSITMKGDCKGANTSSKVKP